MLVCATHDFLNIERLQLSSQQKQTDDHRRITDARDEKSLVCGAHVDGVSIPEPDEQETA